MAECLPALLLVCRRLRLILLDFFSLSFSGRLSDKCNVLLSSQSSLTLLFDCLAIPNVVTSVCRQVEDKALFVLSSTSGTIAKVLSLLWKETSSVPRPEVFRGDFSRVVSPCSLSLSFPFKVPRSLFCDNASFWLTLTTFSVALYPLFGFPLFAVSPFLSLSLSLTPFSSTLWDKMLALQLTPSLLVASFMLFRTGIRSGLSLSLSAAVSRRLFCDMASSSLSPTTFFFRARLLLLLPLMFSGLLVLSVPIAPSSEPFSSNVFPLSSLITSSFGPFLLVSPACPCFVAPLWYSLSRLVVPWSCRKCWGNVVSLLSATVTLLLSALCFLYWHFCPSFVASSLLFPPFLTAFPSFSSSFFTVTFIFPLLLAIFKPFSSQVFSLFSLMACSFGPFLLVTPACPCVVAPLWCSLSRLVVPWSCRKCCGNVVSLLLAAVTLLLSASCFL